MGWLARWVNLEWEPLCAVFPPSAHASRALAPDLGLCLVLAGCLAASAWVAAGLGAQLQTSTSCMRLVPHKHSGGNTIVSSCSSPSWH